LQNISNLTLPDRGREAHNRSPQLKNRRTRRSWFDATIASSASHIGIIGIMNYGIMGT
jgi:hypothetical protein